MAEFTNTVAGEPSIFKVADYHTLGMARGNKGFFAMGDLDREFDTGLPDGEYCDIISECQQKITVSNRYKDLLIQDFFRLLVSRWHEVYSFWGI